LFDTDADAWCSAFAGFVSSEPRCVPASCCDVEDVFADSACETPTQVTRRPADWDFYRYAYDRAGYRELLDPIDAFVRAPSGECVRFGRPPGYNVHALGAPRPREEFLPATLVVD
jgi:hypothetical protein